MRVRKVDVDDAQAGYARVLPYEDPCAVRWWYVRLEADGVVFARGGTCRTSKLARSLIHGVAVLAKNDRAAIQREIAAHERREERHAA